MIENKFEKALVELYFSVEEFDTSYEEDEIIYIKHLKDVIRNYQEDLKILDGIRNLLK